MDKSRKLIGYCSYCKSPIFEGDNYVVREGCLYELDCWTQMNNGDDYFKEE